MSSSAPGASSSSAASRLPPITEADVAYTKKLAFGVLCDMFSVIASHTKRSIKRAALEKLLSKYRLFYTYPVMRLILPHLDRDCQTYSLKESKLAKIVIQILAIAKDSADALRMVNWRQPQRNAATGKHEGGDFAEAVFNSLKNRCASHSVSTIHSVNAHLDALNAAPDSAARSQILTTLVREATAYEMKWIVRIILKDLKIGISEALVFEVFHEDATELYNITSSLYLVCNQLRDPSVRTSHQGISLFSPIKPMLAGRKHPEDIGALISNHNRRFILEQKYDGERIQVHKDGNTIRMFSRNSLEVTDIYPMIRADLYRQIKAKQAIIDGELLVWDKDAQAFEPFGRAKTLAVSEKAGGGHYAQPVLDPTRENKQFCYIAFDILYLEGEAKMHLPLRSRVDLLHKTIEIKDKVVEVAVQTEVKTEQSVIDALNLAIDGRHEGIMVKDVASMYVPNERKDKWTKIKPEYLDGIGDTLDLLILGGLYGSGTRKGASVSHFLLGVQKSPGVYWSVARVGSGYSDAELRQLQTMLQNYWRPYNPANPPKGIVLAESGIKDVPNVWIEPKYSRVLEILAAQITPSEKYRAGYTLRFPRVKRVRLDKVSDQVTTMDELLEMVNNYESRAARTKVTQNKEPKTGKKQKGNIFATHALTGLALAKLDENPEIDTIKNVHTAILAGCELCVINGDDIFRKEVLETLIKNQGGTVVQSPTSKTFCAIAGKMTVKVKLVESKSRTNIVWVKWLVGSIQKRLLLPLEPRFMIYTEESTALKFANEIDEYGDTFERPTDEATLQDVFRSVHVPWLPHTHKDDPAGTSSAKSAQDNASSSKQAKTAQDPQEDTKPVVDRANATQHPGELPLIFPDPIRARRELRLVKTPSPTLSSTPTLDMKRLPALIEAESRYFATPSPPWWALFRSCTIYLDIYRDILAHPRHSAKSANTPTSTPPPLSPSPSSASKGPIQTGRIEFSPLEIIENELKFYGATIVDHLDVSKPLDYVVAHSTDASRRAMLERFLGQYRLHGFDPIIVDEKWVQSCVSKKLRLTPTEFVELQYADLLSEDSQSDDSL